jgi:hypothetical protein
MCVIKYHAWGKTGQNDLKEVSVHRQIHFSVDDQGDLIASYRPPN